MPQDKDRIRLRHMLDHASEAMQMVRGRERHDLDTDRQLNLALVRLLEIVGEASARVSEPTRKIYPQIPWMEIAGLRNRLVHGYDDVDFDIFMGHHSTGLPPRVTSSPSNLLIFCSC